MKTTLHLLCALLLVSGTGCSDDSNDTDDNTSAVCTPGESVACTCTDGSDGAQTCNDEGSGLQECVCDSDNNDTNNDVNNVGNNDTNNDTNNDACADAPGEGLQPSHFLAGGLDGDIEEVDCTLSDGTQTVCYSISIEGAPADHEVGPFCPRNIADGPEAGGLWIKDGEHFDIDGPFIEGLAELYGDDNWQLYDPDTGDINVTDTLEECDAAARPDVAEELQNHCVECLLEYVDGGVPQEYLIPKFPVMGNNTTEIDGRGSVGLALNGVYFEGPAPLNAIISAYTIAAFDDCGGHVNLAAGYHYHAATGCTESIAQCDDHAPLIGYARDGFGIYAMTDANGVEADGLDECRGQFDDVRGYHYHAASPGENMFIGCFKGLLATAAGDTPDDPPDNMDALSCDDAPDGMRCCGDDICDGPETADNCPEDC